MEKLYYDAITEILKNGILKEDSINIQKKMIELSEIHDVNAMKILYLLIRLQRSIEKEKTSASPVSFV